MLNRDEFLQYISQLLRVPKSALDFDLHLQDDLGIDSLRFVTLLLELTEHYSVSLDSIHTTSELKTIGNLYSILELSGARG